MNTPKNACEKVEKPLSVKSVHYSSRSQTLKISFNHPITAPEDLKSALRIELSDPEDTSKTYGLKHAKISLDGSRSRIIIKLNFKTENQTFFEKYQLVINEINKGTMKAERDQREIFKGFPITQTDVTHIESSVADTSVTVAKGASYSLNILSLILAVISVSLVVIMVKLLQLLFFLLYINIDLPSNAARFIYSFRKNILDYFPTFLRFGGNKYRLDAANANEIGSQTSDGLFSKFCVPHRVFEENHQTCSVFVNLGSFITQLVVFFSLKLIVFLVVIVE